VKIGQTVKKGYSWVIFHENSPVAPLKRILRIFEALTFSACRAELIGLLFVEIGSLVEKSIFGVFFSQKSPR
jgi:hypothetical protein